MIRGLPASILLHAGLIVGGSVAWPYISTPIETNYVAVPIEIMELSELASARPQIEREPETEPEEEEPEALPEEEFFEEPEAEPGEEDELPPEEMLASEETQAPASEEQAVALPDETETPEPEAAEEEDEPEPEPEEEEPLRRDVLDDILADAEETFDQDLLDKTPREPRSTSQPRPELTDEQPNEAPSEAQLGAGDRQRNQQSVVNIIFNQMTVCWDDVDDLPNPERLNVTVQMVLNRDGTLKEDVKLVTPARPPIGDRAMQQAIERALRAVRKCAPYRLPEDALASYDDWDEVTLNIGPAYK